MMSVSAPLLWTTSFEIAPMVVMATRLCPKRSKGTSLCLGQVNMVVLFSSSDLVLSLKLGRMYMSWVAFGKFFRCACRVVMLPFS